MDGFLWMLIFASVSLFIYRRLALRNALPINRHLIRGLFLQRLQALNPLAEVKEAPGGDIHVQVGMQSCLVHLDQLYRRCAELPAKTGDFVREAVKGIMRALGDTDALPQDWERSVVPLLLHLDAPTPPDLVIRPVTDRLAHGYVINLPEVFRWITWGDLEAAQIEEAHLHEIAMRNLERSCNQLVIETAQSEGNERLVRFRTLDGLDATRLLLPSFYTRFSPRFDDKDVLVTIPARDALAMMHPDDAALRRLFTWRGPRERNAHAYPLSDTLLLVSETGLTSLAGK